MGDTGRSRQDPRFGIFELDLQAGELRKHGLRIRLQEQPFKVLAALLERPGEVVTREELRKRLWPDDTFVDFDHGLASAINRLREALGDSAENPRYVETLPRRGYRFIAPVDGITTDRRTGVEVPPEEARPAPVAGRLLKSRYTKVTATAGLLAAVAFVTLFLTRPLPPPRVLHIVQLTAGGPSANLIALATDGVRIYFSREQAGRWSLATIPVSGGEPIEISTPLQWPFLEDISPDGSEFLVSDRPEFGSGYPLYIVPVVGGSARRVGNVEVGCAGWLPDRTKILYTHGRGLFLTNRGGSGTRKLVSTPNDPYWPRASPDGKLIRFSQWDSVTFAHSLWQVAADGTGLRPLLPGWNNPPNECCGQWSADGRYYVFQSTRQGMTSTWAIRESVGFLQRAKLEPVRLTDGPIETFAPLVSKDGRKVFVIGNQERAELIRYDAQARQFVPFLPEKSISMLDFTRDGQWLAYVSYPEGTLWKSKPDMTQRVQLTAPPMQVALPRWSPDGKLIAFQAQEPPGSFKIHLVSPQGGTPQPLTPGETADQENPGWSPDGNLLVFCQGADAGYGARDVRLFDVRTRQLSKLPASEGLYSPRWSPDGRYIAALRSGEEYLWLFDLRVRKWIELPRIPVGYPTWSHDSKYIYFDSPKGPAFYRLRVGDRKLEQVLSLEHLRMTGSFGWGWTGLAPDDSPLVLRNLSVQEIYALDWEAP